MGSGHRDGLPPQPSSFRVWLAWPGSWVGVSRLSFPARRDHRGHLSRFCPRQLTSFWTFLKLFAWRLPLTSPLWELPSSEFSVLLPKAGGLGHLGADHPLGRRKRKGRGEKGVNFGCHIQGTSGGDPRQCEPFRPGGPDLGWPHGDWGLSFSPQDTSAPSPGEERATASSVTITAAEAQATLEMADGEGGQGGH